MKDDVISRQIAIEALKICDINEDGNICHICPMRDERWDGAWEDNETNCYKKLMRDSAKLLAMPSAQPVEDIKAMCGECDAWNQYKNYPQPGWIPVTERLPDKEGSYLCTVQGYVGKATYLRIADFHPDIYVEYDIEEHKPGFIDYDSEYGFYEVTKVLAWMPLPKPWEGENA